MHRKNSEFLLFSLYPQRLCRGQQQRWQDEWTTHLSGSGATSGQTHAFTCFIPGSHFSLAGPFSPCSVGIHVVCGCNGHFPSELLQFNWCGCYRNKSHYLGIEHADMMMCVTACVCACLYLWHTTSVPNRHSALAGGGRGVVCVSRTGSQLWASLHFFEPAAFHLNCEVNEQRFPSRFDCMDECLSIQYIMLALHSASSLLPYPSAPLKEGSNLLFRDFSHVHSSWHRCDIRLCMISKFLLCLSHPFSQPWTPTSSVALASLGVCLQVA